MTKNEIEQIETTTNWVKKAYQWIKSILTINQRLRQLEDIHFSDGIHPADICPRCGRHTIRYDIRRSAEQYISPNHYTHIQTKWAFCLACGYEEGGKSTECHTNSPMTPTPLKTENTITSVQRKTFHF